MWGGRLLTSSYLLLFPSDRADTNLALGLLAAGIEKRWLLAGSSWSLTWALIKEANILGNLGFLFFLSKTFGPFIHFLFFFWKFVAQVVEACGGRPSAAHCDNNTAATELHYFCAVEKIIILYKIRSLLYNVEDDNFVGNTITFVQCRRYQFCRKYNHSFAV